MESRPEPTTPITIWNQTRSQREMRQTESGNHRDFRRGGRGFGDFADSWIRGFRGERPGGFPNQRMDSKRLGPRKIRNIGIDIVIVIRRWNSDNHLERHQETKGHRRIPTWNHFNNQRSRILCCDFMCLISFFFYRFVLLIFSFTGTG